MGHGLGVHRRAGARLPLRRCLRCNLRHQLRIERVREEAPGVYSIVCRGRRLDRLAVSGGQFFQWRFLARGLWWQAHPYSLSALPRPPLMRVTVKALGDHSQRHRPAQTGHTGLGRGAVRGLYPSCPVDGSGGPDSRRGRHHARRGPCSRTSRRTWTSPWSSGRRRPKTWCTGDEVADSRRAPGRPGLRRGGPRRTARLDARSLGRLVPDLARRDVYVCGPAGFSEERRVGGPRSRGTARTASTMKRSLSSAMDNSESNGPDPMDAKKDRL